MEYQLAKWTMEYAGDFAKHANNKKIADNMRDAFPFPYTVKDAQRYIINCMEAGDAGRLARAVVIGGEAVGSIGIFAGSDVYSRSAELGYWLSVEFWGKGIMTSAIRDAVSEAFHVLPILRIYAEPYAINMGSRRVLEKAGFVLEGIMKKGVYKNGQILDCCMYAITK